MLLFGRVSLNQPALDILNADDEVGWSTCRYGTKSRKIANGSPTLELRSLA